MSMEEFHGTHPEPMRKDCHAIDWSDAAGRSPTVRVRSHTCDCSPTIYELCAMGGLSHIRRIVRTAADEHVSESPWLRAAAANQLWRDLLEGRAR